MNIEKKTRVRVFGMEMNGKTAKGTISTNEGKDQNGDYKWSSWFARFVNKDQKKVKKASRLEDGTQLVLKNAKIENIWDKKAKKAWYTVTVFDWDIYQPDEDEEDDL